mmetsp:Transcript_10105/g.20102  ORF Transcript_10105/g.20102 Transcript_10105/m.20102 type:complete len:88 (-) Transcript_10105:931-1194(-)
MSKANGKFIVGGFVVMLGAAVGVAQVYLPYYSPQSEKRRDQNTLGKEQKEAEIERRRRFIEKAKREGGKAPGSMWGNMKKGGGGGEK